MLQLFTAPYNDISGIVMDDKYGVRIAMDHLISRGYKRILYIGGDNRVKGYYEALAAAEIPADESLVSLNWSVSEAEICDKIKKLHPDAILGIARQAQTAWCALCALQREGIPELPFVAYDDVNWVKMFNITAVAHPLQEIAETVTQYIFACITSDSNEYTHRVIKPFLIERLTSK